MLPKQVLHLSHLRYLSHQLSKHRSPTARRPRRYRLSLRQLLHHRQQGRLQRRVLFVLGHLLLKLSHRRPRLDSCLPRPNGELTRRLKSATDRCMWRPTAQASRCRRVLEYQLARDSRLQPRLIQLHLGMVTTTKANHRPQDPLSNPQDLNHLIDHLASMPHRGFPTRPRQVRLLEDQLLGSGIQIDTQKQLLRDH